MGGERFVFGEALFECLGVLNAGGRDQVAGIVGARDVVAFLELPEREFEMIARYAQEALHLRQ